jgi:hypothetical protein
MIFVKNARLCLTNNFHPFWNTDAEDYAFFKEFKKVDFTLSRDEPVSA